MSNDHDFELPNGQRLGYARYGHPDGVPAFYFHGLPGSRREGALLHQACLDLQVNLIAPERPGYGLSQPMSGDRHALWSMLVAALADHLHYERFYVLAISGGAPYALACASALPARVRATAICCGLGDIGRAELRAAMGVISRTGFYLAEYSPLLLRLSYGSVASIAAYVLPRLAVDVMCWLNRKEDRIALRPASVKAIFTDNLREAFRQGSIGGCDDMRAAVNGWSFDPSAIQALRLWHGNRDSVVPLCHSEWLQRQVPAAHLRVVDGEGHFSLPVGYAQDILRDLVNEFPL